MATLALPCPFPCQYEPSNARCVRPGAGDVRFRKQRQQRTLVTFNPTAAGDKEELSACRRFDLSTALTGSAGRQAAPLRFVSLVALSRAARRSFGRSRWRALARACDEHGRPGAQGTRRGRTRDRRRAAYAFPCARRRRPMTPPCPGTDGTRTKCQVADMIGRAPAREWSSYLLEIGYMTRSSSVHLLLRFLCS
jgi:hypothetical protein